ncbi:MAG: ABC transporter ATP-binding protein [Pseudomonadota bacterium]
MAVVALDRLSKTYEGSNARAVRDVTFTVPDGEFMVLLGPSGCGKSTTLRMIAGLEPITAGRLSIDDETMNGVPAKNRDIAMVFQSYALYPHMTVEQNLGFGLRRRQTDRAVVKRRVREVAASIGLTEYLSRKPHALSGGQRQRVALGRAIVRDPKVFLFDEPLSNLDAALRVSTRAELVRLHRELSATMIYVTHDQVEAMTMGDRICIMKDGEVSQIGRPMEVYLDPANTFVASFLGNPPMNLVPATATQNGLRVGEAELAVAAAPPGRDVVFGIRPEDLAIAEPGPSALSGRVASVEPLGAETLIHVDMGRPSPLIVRAAREVTPQIDAPIHLEARSDMVRLFDPATGQRLSRKDEP